MASMLTKLVSKAELKQLGWSAAGGAAGTLGAAYAGDLLVKIPLMDKLPPEIRRGLLGAVAFKVAKRWNSDFACGLAGATVGAELAKWAAKTMGMSPPGMADVPEQDFAFSPAPGGPGDEELRMLSEVEPSPQFADIDARVEEEPVLSFLS